MDPFTKKPVFIAKKLKDRNAQRALMQFFKPQNYFEVAKALKAAGRQELIGNGCDCLIPAKPPKEAIKHRRKNAGKQFRGRYVHQIDGPDQKKNSGKKKGKRKQSRFAPGEGYRPDRKSTKKREP